MEAQPQKAVTVELCAIKEQVSDKGVTEQKYCVTPASTELHRGEEVQFYMPPNVDATLMFPYAIFDAQIIYLNMSNDWKVKLRVKPDVSKGEYPYCIFIHKARDFAEGNSPPKVIIVDNGP